MTLKRAIFSAALSTSALLPVMAFAQTQEDCDLLLVEIEARQGQELGLTRDEVAVFIQQSDFAACRQALQQVQSQAPQRQSGEAQLRDGQQEGGNIVVQQPAPTVTVDQAAPEISIQQPQPTVTVRQPQPQILVRQPAPTVTIDIPQPEIIVRMPQPEVTVQQAQPQVSVEQPQPQVQVVQPEQPQVQVQEAEQPVVQLSQGEGEANVRVEQVGEAQVRYERAEPQVTINQAEGQPQVRVEEMSADQQRELQPEAGDQPQVEQQPDAQQPAAVEQQAEATQAGEQEGAAAEMRRIPVSELDGMEVVNQRGEQLGEAEGLVRSAADNRMFVVIDHGGFLGLGEKRIALLIDGLLLQGDRIVVPGLTDEEIQELPEFSANEQFPRVEEDAEAAFRVVAQQ